MYTYKTRGTCARAIDFDVIDGAVTDINFSGGCDGNLKGIAQLAEGRTAQEVIQSLEGITCGRKCTSCPDQLAQALKLVLQGAETNASMS